MNEKYSYKDFTKKKFIDTDASDWNDTEVVGSCFYHEIPNTRVFPDIRNVRFIKCNLDNVVVPDTCTIEGGSHRLIKVQNDGEDWILDEELLPTEPIDKARFIKLGLDYSPSAIPVEKVETRVTEAKQKELDDALQADINNLIAERRIK